MAGKGYKRRPILVDRKIFEANWDKVFGKKENKSYEEKSDKKE